MQRVQEKVSANSANIMEEIFAMWVAEAKREFTLSDVIKIGDCFLSEEELRKKAGKPVRVILLSDDEAFLVAYIKIGMIELQENNNWSFAKSQQLDCAQESLMAHLYEKLSEKEQRLSGTMNIVKGFYLFVAGKQEPRFISIVQMLEILT